MNSPTIIWFRRDLRLADNPALEAAIDRGGPVLPVFIWSPEEDEPWAPGAASRWWLHQSLGKLRDSLQNLGSTLIIHRGPSLDALMQIAAESGAKSVVWNRLYEPAAIARDRQIEIELRNREFAIESFPGHLLFEPGTIRNQAGEPFRVFTAFWKACRKAPAPVTPIPGPRRITERIRPPQQWPESLSVTDLGLDPSIDWAEGLREAWQPGEAGATDRMRLFAEGAAEQYAVERDRPDHLGTSRLSPHLHFGELSPRQVWHSAQTEPYQRQLIWREFAHHLLFHYPHTTTQPMRPEFGRFLWRMDGPAFEAWTTGKTGYPLVDAGMRELWRTGWMHNRVRMVAASFLVKHLMISWQEGAAWFWDTLVDADLANNTMGWQWVAGCGADAAPYFRIFNPALQAGKFDPQSDYVRRWIPELATAYPSPIVDHTAARERALAAFESRSPASKRVD